MWKKLAPYLLFILCAVPCAQAQTDKETITIVLVGNRTVVVDEVTESRDGYWFKRGNITTFLDRERVLRVEHPKPPEPEPAAASAPSEGTGKWRLADAKKVQDFFLAKFKKPLPTTAVGQSDLHTRWGLDHRNGMDVSLHPDSAEGRALIEYLRNESIPYLTFRGPVPGVATGPHIHIGNRSPRVSGR